MENKTVLIIIISIVLFSCSAEENRTVEDADTTSIAETDSILKLETHSDTIVELENKFQLPHPDIEQISYTAQSNGNSHLYAYLLLNFDSLESKVQKEASENYRYNCEFSQTFSERIIYYQRECISGTSQYELITPNVRISELKSLFAILFDSGDYYHWSEDSLSHKTSADGTQGAGGEYQYKLIKDKLKVTILYTD